MKKINIDGFEYEVKEQSDWKGDFNKDFNPGDYVEESIVDYFRDCLPPRNMSSGYLQVGEPYNHSPDENGKYRSTYNTFTKSASGIWKYWGHCFSGETKHRG